MNARSLRRATTVGVGVVVAGPLDVENLGTIAIGDGARIGGAAAPSHLVAGPGARLVVGDRVRIGHGSGIAAHAGVIIGADAVLGPFALVLDTDFHAAGDHAGAGASAPIEIGAGATLGARVTVLRGARIGPGARVLAGSVVTGTVPADTTVAGNPARPLASLGAAGSLGAVLVRGAGDAEPPTADAVRAVVAATLALDAPPRDDQGPHDLAAWDSLGALTLLLALEEAFGVSLEPGEMAQARTVGALADAVARAAERA